MSYVTIPSYEGNSPFIYVYYAEDDTRLALPVLARLYNEGMRMWSWNGSANPNDIRAAQRISACSALLIFLSDNLNRDIDREYFEAMEALRCNKVKYFVRLSDVELPFDWGKSDTNVVIDYVRSNEAAFWLSIYDSDILERCRGSWPTKPVKTGLSVFESVDSNEVSDEYSDILKIIGTLPALDRSGVPINAEDIALFAGTGEEDGDEESSNRIPEFVEDLNNKSIQDLFGMLDEISVSTRQKAEELQQSAEKRRMEQEKAAMQRASLPFQQDVAPITHSDEPPVPALSFTLSAQSVENAAAEMFGNEIISEQYFVLPPEEQSEELPADASDEIKIIDISDITEETDVSEEPAETQPSFEDFIDVLAGTAPVTEPEPEPVSPESDNTSDDTEVPDDAVILTLSTNPKTVEIEEAPSSSLLPPVRESLSGFILPDDKYIPTAYLENEDETAAPSAAERAAAAELSRKQFESALENAAYKVTGRIVARHSQGIHSMGLKVRKPKKTTKPSVESRPKTIKVVAAKKQETEKKHISERVQSHSERRRRSRRKGNAPIEEIPAEETRRISVTPELMRGEKPIQQAPPTPAPIPAPPVPPVPPPAPPADTAVSETSSSDSTASESKPSVRKKRHPHNSSGLLNMLRELRSQQNAENNSVSEDSSSEEE